MRHELYYGGDWHRSLSGNHSTIENPATGEQLGSIAWADAADVDYAVHAANIGFREWRNTAPLERAAIMRRAAIIIREHADKITRIDTADTGVPYKVVSSAVEEGALAFEHFGSLITELKGATIPVGPNNINYTTREPLGVVARINAYNHPFYYATTHAAPALAAGNAVIVKPPDQAPRSSLYLAELIGSLFPKGVINVLPGGRACGEALVAHPKVAKVGLIGSIPAGKAIFRAAADTLKILSFELGGKNALIAYPDTELTSLAAGIVRGMAFPYCGQSCGSTSRVFLHESIYDVVLDRVIRSVGAIKFGDPSDPETEMGCLVSKAHLQKVIDYVEIAKKEGAKLVLGGKRPSAPQFARGNYFEPTIFMDVTPSMRIAREEVFGPILSIIKWHDEDEMWKAVNEIDYGLSASIWTSNITVAHRAAARVEAGYVWINDAGPHYFGAPFGGYKQSGIGREESIEELMDNTQIKNVNVNLSPLTN